VFCVFLYFLSIFFFCSNINQKYLLLIISSILKYLLLLWCVKHPSILTLIVCILVRLHSSCAINTSHNSNLWHYRLGYISNSRLQLIRDPIVIIIKKTHVLLSMKLHALFVLWQDNIDSLLMKAYINLLSTLNSYTVTFRAMFCGSLWWA
jgi:hypothetical protein